MEKKKPKRKKKKYHSHQIYLYINYFKKSKGLFPFEFQLWNTFKLPNTAQNSVSDIT